VGILLARSYQKSRHSGAKAHWLFGLLPVPAILCLLPFVPLSRFSGDCMAVMLLLPYALWVAANVHVPEKAERSLLFLGRISYPLYAIHIPIIYIVDTMATDRAPIIQSFMRIFSIYIALLLATILSNSAIAKGISVSSRWKTGSIRKA
jgi:peptidoglycan/LPS O-acetylase OafA/YrhL